MSRRRGRTIGSVLAELQGDFPDLTISKIRFLETEGLVTPERTASGYRHYHAADVERLRYILAAQRDRFWPLKVIREALDALDRGLTPPADGPGLPVAPDIAPDPDVPGASELAAPASLRLTESELTAASAADPSLVASLRTYGLISPGPDDHFDDAALAVTRAAVALAGFGVEARHLRGFRTAADRQVGLVEQVLTPGRKGGEPDRSAEVLHHCLALHAALVKAGLRSSR